MRLEYGSLMRPGRSRPFWGYGPWTGWTLRPLGHGCGPWLFGPPCWAYYASLIEEKEAFDEKAALTDYIAQLRAELTVAEAELRELKSEDKA